MAENWKQGKCTCPYFLKKYMCKHLVGLAIRLKYVKPPSVAKDKQMVKGVNEEDQKNHREHLLLTNFHLVFLLTKNN